MTDNTEVRLLIDREMRTSDEFRAWLLGYLARTGYYRDRAALRHYREIVAQSLVASGMPRPQAAEALRERLGISVATARRILCAVAGRSSYRPRYRRAK